MPRHPGFCCRATVHYPVLIFQRLDQAQAVPPGASTCPLPRFLQHQHSHFFGLDPECRRPPPEAVGPLEVLCASPLALCPQTPFYSLELAFFHLHHSPQVSGGTRTWTHLPCHIPKRLLWTPPRARMPRVSSDRHYTGTCDTSLSHHLGPFSLRSWAVNKQPRSVFQALHEEMGTGGAPPPLRSM